jgi:tetratricopeptide (TPR) repeat protein
VGDAPAQAVRAVDATQTGAATRAGSEQAPGDFNAELAQARKLLAQGSPREALPVFDRALVLRAHSVDALLGKASALFALQDFEAARSNAQQAIAIDPRSNQGFVLIGQSYERMGQRAVAKGIYERCIEQALDLTQCRERLNQLSATP